MSKLWRLYICLFLAGVALGLHAMAPTDAPVYGVALEVKRQQAATPIIVPTPTNTYHLTQNYQALDVFHYFLYHQRIIYADFPHSVAFSPEAPASFVGFTDQTETTVSHWYVIAVFQKSAQTQKDYRSLKNTTDDALIIYNRCMFIGAGDTPRSLIHLYFLFLQAACHN